MTRRVRFIAYAVVVFGVLLAMGVRACHPTVIRHKNRTAQIKLVGLALKMYADDHGGRLPHPLEDMMPVYFTDRRLLKNVQFLAADEKLAELPASTIIARRTYPDENLVSELRADQNAEAHTP